MLALIVLLPEALEAFHNSPRFSGFPAATGFCVLLLVDAATRWRCLFQRDAVGWRDGETECWHFHLRRC